MAHTYEKAAARIIEWLHHAEHDLLGRTASTFNGDAGTIYELRLDEHHGLCFTFEKPAILSGGPLLPDVGASRRFFPVSTIKLYGEKDPNYEPPDHH